MAGLSPEYQLVKGTGHRQQSQTRDLAGREGGMGKSRTRDWHSNWSNAVGQLQG